MKSSGNIFVDVGLSKIDTASFDLSEFVERSNRALIPIGLSGYPFNVRWYNQFRLSIEPASPQLIESSNEDAVGFAIISSRDFFKFIVKEFDPASGGANFVDTTVDRILNQFSSQIHQSLLPVARNTDRPPFIHVQSIGHVAGIDEYVPGHCLRDVDPNFFSHRDPELWGDLRSRLLGVSIHPRYGGWYAYRMLVVLKGISWPEHNIIPRPLTFLSSSEKSTIIHEYNKNADLCKWRDFCSPDEILVPYDAVQYLFFNERSVGKRRRVLELLQKSGYHLE